MGETELLLELPLVGGDDKTRGKELLMEAKTSTHLREVAIFVVRAAQSRLCGVNMVPQRGVHMVRHAQTARAASMSVYPCLAVCTHILNTRPDKQHSMMDAFSVLQRFIE